jgi:hypothetical protein
MQARPAAPTDLRDGTSRVLKRRDRHRLNRCRAETNNENDRSQEFHVASSSKVETIFHLTAAECAMKDRAGFLPPFGLRDSPFISKMWEFIRTGAFIPLNGYP